MEEVNEVSEEHFRTNRSAAGRKRKHYETFVISEILSSTLNDSIPSQLENCRIDSITLDENISNLTPPTTPTKTFKPSPKTSPKLGSPERAQILYPKLASTTRKRLNDSKCFSPVKKQLFSNVLTQRDPVRFFYKENNLTHILRLIFDFLSDQDLYTCTKVSKCWRTAVKEFGDRRLTAYIDKMILNKENNFSSPCSTNGLRYNSKQSPPVVWEDIHDLTVSLTEGQYLQHCSMCSNPTAVVDNHISQCTREKCGFISCLKCGSCSTNPKDFVDSCEGSILVCNNNKSPKKRQSATDSPWNTNESSAPWFSAESPSSSSSGYMTGSDVSSNQSLPHASRSLESRDSIFKLRNIVNANADKSKMNQVRRQIVPVLPNKKKAEVNDEPCSPPDVKTLHCCVGSKKSKRALRRLLL